MLRYVTVFAAVVALTLGAAAPSNVFEIDISPEEAQKYLNSPPFTEPQLSGRTGVLPLVRWNDPRFRAAEAGPTLGHYWKNGKEIENTDDYVEEVYDAAQFHGQDGLGGYAYGYQAPESSKVENRERSGDVTGSYTYKSGDNDIKVRYWADSEGFHQEDNLPKVELKPQEEAEDVRQARLAHEKAWQEAAAAAAQQPDPQGEYSAKYDYQPSASENQGVSVSAPGVAPREGKAYAQAQSSYQPNQLGQQRQQFGQQQQYQQQQPQQQFQQQQPQQQYQQQQPQQQNQQAQQGQYSQQTQQYNQQGQYSQQGQQQQYGQQQGQHQGKLEEQEPTGPPRGFFYSFNYPVSIIVPKNAQGGQGGPLNPGQPIDHDTVGVNAQRG